MPPVRPELAGVIVETQAGPVEGQVGGNVTSFKGIPYAAPPFGANRFLPPQPPAPWTEVRPAFDFGPVPPQSPYPEPFRSLLGDSGSSGQDCLSLNVWTPTTGGSRLPVMVWIHGGAFLRGSSAVPAYDGTRFARDGVVCVSLNYRLGADGCICLGGKGGNFGLLDQIAGLGWVRDNIAAFGGDPDNVTVFGQSAGAFSIASLLAIKDSAGLFQRAILQSGAGHHVTTPATAERIATMLCERLEAKPTLESLAEVPHDRFVAAQAELGTELVLAPDPARWGEVAVNGMMFEPVIDGVVLAGRPIDVLNAGASADVELLIGTTTEEWRFFVVPNGVIDYLTEDHVLRRAAAYGLDPAQALARYRDAQPQAAAGDLHAAMVTDWFYRIPAIRLAEARQRDGGAVHMYEFAWRSPLFNGRLGSCHALELGYVFNNLDRTGPMTGDHPPQQVADEMHRAWIAFARTGDPGWPSYHP
ncbi:MAG TPA: carboxylesterase family protein, partial [Candidatus Dormibacteraeota bacterium]